MGSPSPLASPDPDDGDLPLPPPSGLVPRRHSLEIPHIQFDPPPTDLFLRSLPAVQKPASAPRGVVLAKRYHITSVLGEGAFGRVVGGFDAQTHAEVAVKVVADRNQGAAELAILNALKGASTAIAEFRDAFVNGPNLCLVFELLGPTVYSTMSCRTMTAAEIRSIARDLFAALAATHARGIVHCDVKPENILYCRGSKSRVKIADFGSSCVIGQPLFQYFQSRFYRAPEVILQMGVDTAVDIWGAGCVLAEMAIGEPLFQGTDERDQLKRFVEVIGQPPAFMRAKMNIQGVRQRRKKQLKKKISDRALRHLIGRCLVWAPAERITAHDALADPFCR
jgi:serine/threonine protein kinase